MDVRRSAVVYFKVLSRNVPEGAEWNQAVYLISSLFWKYEVGFFWVKGPAADATDAPQPWGLLCNPVMKMISFF